MVKPCIILLLAIGTISCGTKPTPTVGVIGDSAMVVSAHPIASQVGVDVLRKGGNAIDAAVAVQLALCVVFPEAGNIGGGGFMVMRDAGGKAFALDFRERAPARSSRDMFLDSAGNVILIISERGHLASGVPGSVYGMVEMHKKFGVLPWKDLVQPAIDLALNGHALTPLAAKNLSGVQDELEKFNTIPPSFLLREWSAGDTIRWIELGHTLERIRDQGLAGFYEGKTADDLVAEMNRGKGLITHEDLKNYTSRWLEPVTRKYKEYTVISMPPPSSGGIALIQLLNAMEEHPIENWGHNSAQTVHVMTEAERRVYADRAVHLGDPAFYNVPVTELLDKEYMKNRMSAMAMDKATPSSEVREGSITIKEPTETTHISIVDPEGNAVSVTTTLNDWFGSRVVVPGSGFFLNNEMDDFSMKPGVPNAYGVTGGIGNEIQPMKTMLSSMTPTILEKDGKLFMVVGSPGGPRIITAVFQVVLNVVDHGMGMQEAVDAKRFHSQWLPDALFLEKNAFSEKDSLRLHAMGHTLQPLSALEKSLRTVGRVDAILVLKNGKLEAGADRFRGDDAAAGY